MLEAVADGQKLRLRCPSTSHPFCPTIRSKDITQGGKQDERIIVYGQWRSDSGKRRTHNGEITVILAEDHAIVRDILCYLLESAGDIQIVAVASNGQEAVAQALLHCPDVTVMDISMPIMDGIEATKQICAHCHNTHVVIISMHQTSQHIQRSIQAGASGYVLKDRAGDDLIIAVHSLYEGNRYFSKQIASIAAYFI